MNAEPLQAQDIELIKSLKEGNEWLRAILCTLARRGVELRNASPDRASALLDALSRLPFYKGGQFLFDLLELEDYMLDGPAPEILSTTLDAGALQRLARALNAVKRSLDGQPEVSNTGAAEVEGGSIQGDLPPLEAGFFLYQDVVLGVWGSVVQSDPVGRIS
ncbi:MAG: hypothetical protein WB992_18970 [Bryobacteraceae bacterium]